MHALMERENIFLSVGLVDLCFSIFATDMISYDYMYSADQGRSMHNMETTQLMRAYIYIYIYI